MMSLGHAFHEHALSLRELSEKCSIDCSFCRLDVHGPTYCCLDCDFFLHESCATVPPKIRHPSHPQHPLALSTRHFSYPYRCGGCKSTSTSGFVYCCDDCKFIVDVACAALILPLQEQKNEAIQHFAHEHPLTSFHVSTPNRIKCRACEQLISGPVFGCRGCVFVIHESCARFPQEIQHPFHHQHPLALVPDVKLVACKACYGNISNGFAYRCNKCQFTLDVRCAVSTLPPDGLKEEDRIMIDHFSHQHRLTSVYVTKENDIHCKACDRNISGEVYCCGDCIFLLHKSCADLPRKMVHFLHPDHSLNLREKSQYCNGRFRCNCCSNGYPGFTFNCAVCKFDLDPECALQTLSAFDKGVDPEIQYFAHDHRLTLCFFKENILLHRCDACHDFVHGLAYCCLTCKQRARVDDEIKNFVLHESCSKLPRELEHPFHPSHPLVLLSEVSSEHFSCSACRRSSKGFAFHCAKCEFYLDIECGLRRPSLKHHLHEHKLAYFNKCRYLECSSCYNSCNTDLYRCVPCNFNLHHDCLPLPPTIKHELHIHPLALRDRFVVDYLNENDQYCDLCETLRNPDHGVYYCDECYCAAHISCVLPPAEPKEKKIFKSPELITLEEEIANLEAEAQTAKAYHEAVMKKLDALKIKRDTEFF